MDPQLDEARLEREEQLAVELARRGLDLAEARKVAFSIVGEQGVVGNTYVEQMIEPQFDAAMTQRGYVRAAGGAWRRLLLDENRRFRRDAPLTDTGADASITFPFATKKTPSTADTVLGCGALLLVLCGAVWLFGGFRSKPPAPGSAALQAEVQALLEEDQRLTQWKKKAIAKQWTQQADLGNGFLRTALASIRRMINMARTQHHAAVTLEDVLYELSYEDILDLSIEFDRCFKAPDADAQIKSWADSWIAEYGTLTEPQTQEQ